LLLKTTAKCILWDHIEKLWIWNPESVPLLYKL